MLAAWLAVDAMLSIEAPGVHSFTREEGAMKVLLIVMLSALALACASDVFAQGKPIGAEEGCDTACRAARNNPKPNFFSPEVSPDGKVTVRVYAPKATSIGIGGLEPLNENGESEVAAAKKGAALTSLAQDARRDRLSHRLLYLNPHSPDDQGDGRCVLRSRLCDVFPPARP
jgi:hypothetical protein